MNLLDLVVKITCDDQASGEIDGISSSISGKIGSAAKVAVAGIAAIGTATAALTVSAVSAYSSYQQLVGGVETLFGAGGQSLQEYAASVGKTVDQASAEYDRLIASQEAMLSNADNAYKNAGMSANQYMETATSFAASLIQGLGGDTAKAVEVADMAITDMSDNANKMGTDINMIREAYQGFAKDNYDMLDNLKLGYGGTQAEMARLINDTGVLGDSMEVTAETVNNVPFDKMIEAIHKVQTEMGITGTTSKEAATTIEGSINTAKAAWENWLAGMANPDADMGALTDQLVESVVTAGQNILPAVGEVLTNLGTSISEKLPEIFSTIMEGLSEFLPEDTFSTLQTVFDSLYQVFTSIGEAISTYLIPAFETLSASLGPFIEAIAPVVEILAVGLVQALAIVGAGLGQVIGFVTSVITKFGEFVSFLGTIPGSVGAFIDEAVAFFSALPGKIGEFLSQVISDLGQWVSDMGAKAMEAMEQFLQGVTDGFNSVVDFVSGIPDAILSTLGDLGSLLWDAGSSIMDGLLGGLKEAAGAVYDWVSGVAGTIASLKGPIPYDLKLLIPNGKAIMQSLATGLEKGFPVVADELSRITSDIESMQVDPTFSVKSKPVIDGGEQGKVIARETTNNYNFYNPVKTPYETARAIRMQQTYGLAGAR